MNTGGKRTAHPKMDPETGEMVWFGYWVGPQPFSNLIDYGVTDKTGKVTRRDRFAAPYASVIHDFMVTRNYVMFPILPLTGDLERAKKGLPPMAWEPAKGAFIGVMKRNASVDSIRWFEIEPKHAFHAMNAWEDGEKIHCEVMEYPNAPVFPNADGSPGRDAQAKLTRWTIDLAGKTTGQSASRSTISIRRCRASMNASPACPIATAGIWRTSTTSTRWSSMPSSISTSRPASAQCECSTRAMRRASRSSCRVRPPRRKAMATSSPWSIARRPIPANS